MSSKSPGWTTVKGVAIVAMIAVSVVGATFGQQQAPGAADDSLREDLHMAIRDHFGKRLREELSLTDEQVATILPRIEKLEAERNATRAARARDLQRLRKAYDQDGDDKTLLRLLTRVDASQRDLHELERETLEEVDQGLSVRQQVQLRFFMQTFRREMQEQVRQLRRDRAGPAGRVNRRPGDRSGDRP